MVNSHIFYERRRYTIFEAEDLLISADAPVICCHFWLKYSGRRNSYFSITLFNSPSFGNCYSFFP